MSYYQKLTDRLLQINTLKKNEKDQFVSLISSQLMEHGFEKVTKQFSEEKKYWKAIRFEKIKDNDIGEWIELIFDKYGGPKFYVTAGQVNINLPKKVIRRANVILKKNQFQYWWGTRWYTILRKQKWSKDVKRVQKVIPQVIRFLDKGIVGDNIKAY